MELSRQNLALIGVGGAVAVLAVGIVLANRKIAQDVDAALDVRSKLSKSLVSLNKPIRMKGRNPLRINSVIVAREQERVRKVEQSLQDVRNDCTEWNRRNFTILSASAAGRDIAAFPVDRRAFEDFGELRWNLTQAYLDEVNLLLAPLKLAAEFSQQELKDEAKVWKDRLRGSPDFKGMAPEEREQAVDEAARQRARDTLINRNVTGKLIYANSGVLERRFDKATREVEIEDLWHAQVSLWTMQDIIEAIRSTNELAVEGIELPTVFHSAVKRLNYIRVVGYATDDPGRSVTDRNCTGEYDVVLYRFSVVMPMRYIESLQRELMSSNYHTIVKVSTEAVYLSPEDDFGYGSDPVVSALFEGELLLLTTWERGTWDDQANAWSEDLPPLMPQEVLSKLARAGAARAEDSHPRD